MVQVRKHDDAYRLVVETILDCAIFMLDANGRVFSWNAGAERIKGYSTKDILGRHFALFYPREDAQRGKPEQELLAAATQNRFEDQGWRIRKDGSRFWAHVAITAMRDEAGDLTGFVTLTRDLTDQRNRENELWRSHERFQRAVESAPNAMVMVDRAGRIEMLNLQTEVVFGYSRDELLGRPIEVLIPARFRGRHPEHRMSFFANPKPRPMGVGMELYALRKDGSEFPIEIGLNPIETNEGAMVLAAIVDITDRKKKEDELRRSEERFRRAVESAPSAMLMVGPTGRIEMANLLAEQVLGYSRTELVGQTVEILIPERFRTKHPGLRAEFFSDPKSRPIGSGRDLYALRKDGSEFPVEIGLNPIETEEGPMVLAAIVDITDRKAFEDALRVRDRAIEATSVVIADAQAHGGPNIYVNPALSRITGYSREELLRQNMRLLQGPDTDPAAVEQIRQAINSGGSCEVVLKNYRKGGAPFWNELLISPVFDDKANLTHYIGIQTDVTERRRAEERRHELEIARRVQLSLLPEAPLSLPQAEIAGVCVPASDVGGDYFDFFRTRDAVDIVIADVSGHSVGAALVMAEVRSALRAETRKMGGRPASPAQVLSDLNDVLYDDLTKAELFLTMFYVRYQMDTRTLRYANAGHNRALLLRMDDASCSALDAEGLVLGVRREVDFEERSLELAVGDRLLLYTDGITEAENQSGEFFEVARLCTLFSTYRTLSPEALLERLLAEVRVFCGETPIRDDISMAMLQVR
jgi:sigma-B regulation protein RsbU (phosphoserine phosphatase)